MENFRKIIAHNREWAAAMKAADPEYFIKRAAKQEPLFLYIGCADSRVPANVVTGTEPGDLFVHRNIANVVLPSDLNAMSVLQYAVEVLEVQHVIVTGHYNCGGVKAAMGNTSYGLVDLWLQPIRNVIRWNRPELEQIADEQARYDRVVELNVLDQLYHLSETPIIQHAWARKRRPLLHGLVYDINEGLLREIATGIDSEEAADALAQRRHAGIPAEPPPIVGRFAQPALPVDEPTEEIARRVQDRLSIVGAPRGSEKAP